MIRRNEREKIDKRAMCTSYHMATTELANLSHEDEKRPRAIN